MVKGTTSINGNLQVLYGPLHLPFGIYFVSCLSLSLFILIRKLTLLTGLQKLQVRYLFAGVALGAIGATVTNLVIPLVFGISRFSRFGPLFGILMIAVIAHAIIRYRLMDIKLFIRKGVVYVIAIITAASAFFALAELLHYLMGYQHTAIPLAEALVLAVTVAIFFQPLKRLIQDSLNRYVYRHAYDYQRTVRETSLRLSTTLDLRSLLDYLAQVIERTFQVDVVSIYLLDDSSRYYSPPHLQSLPDWRQVSSRDPLSSNAPIITLLTSRKKVLVRDELTHRPGEPEFKAAIEDLRLLGADILFPLLQDDALAGFIVIGPKRSGDPFFSEDIDLLSTLVSQAGVAMKNAQLYRQVVLINEYVDNILSTMESGVIAVDATGRIALFNRAAELLTGLRFDALRTESYLKLPAALGSPLEKTLREGTRHSQLEVSIRSPEGATVPLVCSTAPLIHKDGPTHGALIVFSDLTRLKDLEREKTRAERLASFGALASGVAHEIKNPLVAIRTFAELLPERFADPDFREDFSKVVITEIARIDDLVARLRGIAATARQHVGAVDIREPIVDTISLLRGQIEQTHTTVDRDFQDHAPYVAIDEAHLKQLFLNLFLNAIEAMGSRGKLRIRITRRQAQPHSWIVIEISDTGPGVPEPLRGKIFDPFFTTKPRGSGLGLTICRGITDAHRGTIRAEASHIGSGTTIVVEFPAASPIPGLIEHAALTG